MLIPLFLFYRGINKTQCRAGRHKHGLITFPSPFQAVVLDSCPQPCFPAHLRGWRGTANSCFIPKVCWHTRERVPFIMWSSSSNVIILPNVYITFWKGTWQTESSWDKWDCILERHPHMQYWWASWSLVDEVYSTGWVESLVVTSLGSAHRDGFYFLIEWGLCATKDGLQGEIPILKSSALHWLLWEEENTSVCVLGWSKSSWWKIPNESLGQPNTSKLHCELNDIHSSKRKKIKRNRNTWKSVNDSLPHPIQWTGDGKRESAFPSGLNTQNQANGSILWPICRLLKDNFALCADIRT